MVETCYIHFEFQDKNGGWSINLPFLCDKCGVCCTLEEFLNAGELQGNPIENRDAYVKFNALKEELGKIFAAGEDAYDWHITHNMCPFKTGNECSIYTIRPKGCRQFPNTMFGMLSDDCKALDRFKKQRIALKRGRTTKETFHFTSEPIEKSVFSQEQFGLCLSKLEKAGITIQEKRLFKKLNGK